MKEAPPPWNPDESSDEQLERMSAFLDQLIANPPWNGREKVPHWQKMKERIVAEQLHRLYTD